ncbi:MAG: hypothetical protein IJ521_12495 [Schwartzia sp.]|nr:hypothetical protein [Schwartzia sp. (in: firmicutes)]
MLASEKYIMPRAKIQAYLLKPGGKHAQEFFAVGYTPNDVEKLHHDIEAQFDESKATSFRKLPDGAERFTIFMELGVTKKRPFLTVWQRNAAGEKPKFVTAHREKVQYVRIV